MARRRRSFGLKRSAPASRAAASLREGGAAAFSTHIVDGTESMVSRPSTTTAMRR
jgi:hypothetical protein